MIHLGDYAAPAAGDSRPVLLCESAELRPHLNRPWMQAYLRRQAGTPGAATTAVEELRALVDPGVLARHCLVCGATGSGKTRGMLHLVLRQSEQGCSVALLDPKGETAELALRHLCLKGTPPGQIVLLDPAQGQGVPGLNPFLAGVPVVQAATDLVAVLEQSAASWGPRLQDLLTNALLVVGFRGLSLFELARLLLRPDYRSALLASLPAGGPAALAEARSYFEEEFDAWTRSERAQAVAPVLNKLRELLRSEFLRPLLCARRNTLDLAQLWHRPGLVLARLDRAVLGEEGTRLLAGLLASLLFRTALRARGPVPVVLAIDELPVIERFVGRAMTEIVTLARSQGLRLLVACQHLAQLSDSLREALLANTALQLFFRLGHADARLVAASLAAGTPASIRRATVSLDEVDRATGAAARTEWRHPVLDAHGRPLRASAAVAPEFHPSRLRGPEALRRALRLAAAARVPRLYVRSADSREPVELARYLAGVDPGEYWLEGPALELVVSFPRPRLQGVERAGEAEAAREWAGCLQDLPPRHAVLRQAGSPARVVRIAEVRAPAVPAERLEAYAAAALRANGQSSVEVAAAQRWRQEEVARIARGQSGTGDEEAADGSLA